MDAIVAVDEGQLVILFNAAAERMFGCPAAQALGQPLDQFIPSRYHEAHRQHIPRFGQSGQTHRTMCRLGEVMGRRANGEEFPLEAAISQTEVDGKKIYTAILRDISARKRDEEIRARLAAIVESSDDAIIGKNLDGIITNWNHAAEQMFGYTAAEILGQPITVLLPPDRLAEEARIIEKIRAGERVPHFETIRRCKNGADVEVWLTVSPIRDAAGRVVGASKIVRDITENKRTENAFRLFRALVDQSNDAFEIIDPVTGRFLDVTMRDCLDLGYTREELLALTVFDIDPTVKREVWPDLMRDIHRVGSRIIEGRHLRKDGTTFPVELNIRWVRVDRDYVVTDVRDITQRKQAEEKLRFQETLLRETGRIAKIGGWHFDVLTGQGFWTEEVARIHDVDPEAPIDRDRGLGFYHGEHRARIEAAIQAAIAQATPYDLELEIVTAAGQRKWIRTIGRPVTEGGRVVRLRGSLQDITHRKQQELALRETTERFQEIAENIHEVFWVTNPSMSAIYYVSPAYEKIWGRTCANLYADPYNWIAAIHPEDRERVGHAAATKGVSGTYDEIYRIIQPNGSLRWIHDRGFPVRDADGEIIRLVGVAEDITTQRKLEDQFRQAQKMEAIGTLAGGIAHDFNNILAAVNGYAELAKLKAGADSPLHSYLDAIGQAGNRAAALVRQILTFSRQQEQQRRPVQLGEIIDETHKLLRATIPATIEFVVTKAPQMPNVLADPTQIHQVLMNLGTNAWQAMRERPGRLEINAGNFEVDQHFAAMHPRLRPGHYVRISIADTGSGMSEATLARIFEPFFTTKPKGEGTGLGLSVVHGIMESHDGLVTVYSKLGEGTIFHLYFPAHQGASAAPATSTGPTPQGEGKHILYVDDEEALAKLGQKTLEQLGYVVEMSTNVSEALDLVRREPQRFDLVITDQTMPGMTGVDFAAQLLKIRPQLPIILTTGYSAYLTAEHVHSLGIRDLLLKPHTLHTLGTAVHKALSPVQPA